MTQFRIKRVYEDPDATDGYRVLVDRLWPRGIKKEHLKYDVWEKGYYPFTRIEKMVPRKPSGTLGRVCSHVSQGTGKFGSRP